jgi:hypothetical protein
MTVALAWAAGAGVVAQPRQITRSWASLASWSAALPSEACAAADAGFDRNGNFCGDDRLGSSAAPSQANAPSGCEPYVPTNVDWAHPASAVDTSSTAIRKEILFGIVASAKRSRKSYSPSVDKTFEAGGRRLGILSLPILGLLDRMNDTVFGATENLAARLQALNR